MIFIKSQSSIVVNILNTFIIIVINKNNKINIYQKNFVFNIKKSIF